MSHWEAMGKSDEHYTPKYIFDALGCTFDMDVACPKDLTHVSTPAKYAVVAGSLVIPWHGFVWMNPPFGGRNGIVPWLNKFIYHGNGICLTPDRTSAPWWHDIASKADAVLFIKGKVKFVLPDGSTGNSPSVGSCLFAIGEQGVRALRRAHYQGLGLFFESN